MPELARKSVRFAERVEEQTPEGVVIAIPQQQQQSQQQSKHNDHIMREKL